MANEKLRVAIIGCGRMGQHYTDVYNTFENTEVVAIAEYNDDRRNVVGERFGVKALFKDAEEMYQKMDEVPDLAVVVIPAHAGIHSSVYWTPAFGDPGMNSAHVIANAAERSEESKVLGLQAEFRSWNGLNDDGKTS